MGNLWPKLEGLITELYQQQEYKSIVRYGIASGVCLVVTHQTIIWVNFNHE